MAWIAQVAVAAYGAYQSSSAAKKKAKADAAGKNEISYRTPYMNDYISQIAPYILSEAGKMYQSRLGKYANIGGGGYKPGDFSPIAARLAGIPSSYSGVGAPEFVRGMPSSGGTFSVGGGPSRPQGYSNWNTNANPFSGSYGQGNPKGLYGEPTQEQIMATRKGYTGSGVSTYNGPNAYWLLGGDLEEKI